VRTRRRGAGGAHRRAAARRQANRHGADVRGLGGEVSGFSGHYRYFAERSGCEFLDAAEVIVSSDVDGIHLDASEHRKLGEAVAARIRGLMG
jgi:hypothetical protein